MTVSRLADTVGLTIALAISLSLLVPSARSGEQSPAGGALVEVTDFWRCHFTWKTELVKRHSGELEFARILRASRGRPGLEKVGQPACTPLPSADWAGPDFDDSSWVRARGPFYARQVREIALVCLRGRFDLAEPRELKLALTYRGGARVLVNGKELARGGLPEGAVGPETPGESYPVEAYVGEDKVLLRWVGFGDPEKHKDRFAMRDRRLEATIPASALKKGINVLALELHRAPTDETLFTAPSKSEYNYSTWAMVGLIGLELRPADGTAPAPAAPAGKLAVWNHPISDSLHSTDFGTPGEKLIPVRMEGTLGGVFSGQVVIELTGKLSGLKASVSALKGSGGTEIPAAAASVRFPAPDGPAEDGNEGLKPNDGGTATRYARGTTRFETLREKPPAEVAPNAVSGRAIQPVWVTVRVPREAKPGEYRGALEVSAAGAAAVQVPVVLNVAGWRLPEPRDFVGHVGLIQSPTTLAMKYDVPMWSDRHWGLIDRAFAYAGELGTKTVYVPVLRHTYFGNEHGMVRWIKGENGQSWKHDFSLVEKYLDVATKHLGKPPVVCFICWELSTGSAYMDGKHEIKEKSGAPFTVLAPDGKLEEAVGPKWGDAESVAFWKPVLTGLRDVLARRGLEKSMMVGITGDRQPGPEAVKDLKAALDVPWVSASHTKPVEIRGQPVAYKTQVWGIQFPPDPAEKRLYGWKRGEYVAVFPRFIATCMGKQLRVDAPLGMYNLAEESALVADLRGVGRCGLDFWEVLVDKRGRTSPVLGRYPENSNWHGGWLHNSFPHIVSPGEDGPLATERFENYREGIQAAEARIYLEKALLDPAQKARLGEELAARVQEVLDERVRAIRRAAAAMGCYSAWKHYVAGTAGRSARLWAAAAEVAGKLGDK